MPRLCHLLCINGEDLPRFKANTIIGVENRVLLEIRVVAMWVVGAEVRAAAFGAGERRTEDGASHAAQGLRFSETAAGAAACCDLLQVGFDSGQSGESLAQ